MNFAVHQQRCFVLPEFPMSKRRRMLQSANSVASSVLPPCSPALLPPRAVKDRFSKFLIYIIVCVTQPCSELATAAGLDGIFTDVGLKVLSADPARVQPREKLDEANHVVLLSRAGTGRICGCYGVEKCP